MARQRLSDWMTSPSTAPADTGNARSLDILVSTLRASPPGQWSANVFELSRHFTSATYLAVNTLAKHAMDSKFKLHERVDSADAPNGKVELAWHDPAVDLFENPNPVDTFADLMYQTVQQLSITGMGMTWAPPSERDEPAELYNLATCTLWPMPPSPQFPFGAYRASPYMYANLWGPVQQQSASGALIPAEQIIKVKNHHPFLRFDGYATLTAIQRHVDTLEAIDLSRFNTMQQGCEQTLALESTDLNANPMNQEDLTRLRTQLRQVYAGPANAGKIWVPDPGWKLTQISTVPKDMAWQEGWSQVLDFVLAAFGVPKAVAGLQEATSYATLYSSLRAFCLFSLGPIVRQIARSWNKHIVQPSWGKEITLEICAPEFKDETLEETKLANDLKCGALKIKEWRRMRGYDHVDEPWTDERAIASYSPQAEAGGDNGTNGKENQPESNGPRVNDPAVDNSRPAASKSMRIEYLARAFEKAKTNGTAHPIKN